MKAKEQPWQPLYMIERSGQPEVVVYGIVVVVTADGANETRRGSDVGHDDGVFIEQGDSSYKLWTRSLLKPWQLLSHFRMVRESYPKLTEEQLALMTSSHSAEQVHLNLLSEIMGIGKLKVGDLKCPPTFPMSSEMKENIQRSGKGPSPEYHNCSGKHSSYLLSLQAQGLPFADYTDFAHPEHDKVDKVLAEALCVNDKSFDRTTDGCQLPNQNLTLKQIASLYRQFAEASASEGIENWNSNSHSQKDDIGYIGSLVRRYPKIIGGTGRIDTRIMSGALCARGLDDKLIAKGGADGLLAIGLSPNSQFKNGAGVVIKLAGGNDNKHMELIAAETLRLLGLSTPPSKTPASGERTDHLKTTFFLETTAT